VAYAKSVSNSVLEPRDKRSASSDKNSASTEPSKLFLDWTQDYLFQSDKLIGILPNPIDRALAQYQATEFDSAREDDGEKKPISFEHYDLADIAALMETGVLQD
jgi:predicted protein tyrosine phosphatase